MVQQHVVAARGLEDVDGGRRLHLGQTVVGGGQERGVLQLLAREVGDAVQAAQVQRSGQPVDLVLADAELADQQLEDGGVDGLLDLQAHRGAEAAAQQLLLQGGEEVLGVVLLDLEVLVPGDPEGVHLLDLHAGEEPVEVLGDDVLERDEALVAQRHEAAEDRRHLHAREVLLVALGVADQHREVERETGDVGERVRRVDGQRGEDREDPLLEHPLALLLLVAVQVGPPDQLDALAAQGRDDLVVEQLRLALAELTGDGEDLLEHLARHQPGGGLDRHARGDPALEARDAHHEELVEVAGEDRQEPHPLQQRDRGVLGQLEHPLVEPQPRQLAVQEALLEGLDLGQHLVVGHVGRLDVERLLRRGVGDSLFPGGHDLGGHAAHPVTAG